MPLQVTCHEDCLGSFDNATQWNRAWCTSQPGCIYSNSSGCTVPGQETLSGEGWIGVVLSLAGDIVINVGMNAMKYAHNSNTDEETGEPIKHYLSLPLWYVPDRNQPIVSEPLSSCASKRVFPQKLVALECAYKISFHSC